MTDDDKVFPGQSLPVLLGLFLLAAMVAIVLMACALRDGRDQRLEASIELERTASQRDACSIALRRMEARISAPEVLP